MNITPKYINLFRRLSSASTDLKDRQKAQKGPLRKLFFKKDHSFNNEFSKIVNNTMLVQKDVYQKDSFKSTGNCWSFAFCNVLEALIHSQHKNSSLQLNPLYILFWDKLEKANKFLHNIIQTRSEPLSKVNKYLTKGITDGGNYNYFINIVHKYGVIPLQDMPLGYHFYSSTEMNELLSDRLREYAFIIRNHPDLTKKQLKKMIVIFLTEVYRFLYITLGTPPKTIKFKMNKKDRLQKMTPQTFYQKYIPIDIREFICLVHNPCKPFYQQYKLPTVSNMVNGISCQYYNLPMTEIQRLTKKSIDKDIPLWSGCDSRSYHSPDTGILDEQSFHYDTLLGFTDSLDKCPHLQYSKSESNHAIIIKGYDTNSKKQLVKWLAEDSHPTGYQSLVRDHLVISPSWFRKFVYKIVIPKQLLESTLLQKFKKVVKVCKKFF